MKKYVISLGGSLINSPAINLAYLRAIRRIFLQEVKKGAQLYIVVGGGQLCRDYQKAARRIATTADADLDWVGIAATKLNAELVRAIFGKLAYPRVIADPSRKVSGLKKINIFSGWKPGWSTDFDAVKLAGVYRVKTVINLSNVDYVYDADPRRNPRAARLPRLSWRGYRRIVGAKWRPGANLPFDPVAAQLAAKLKLRVIFLNGKNLRNLQALFAGRAPRGTIIS